MKYDLFYCSDTHGSIPYCPEQKIDAYLHAGDFYDKGNSSRRQLFGPKMIQMNDWIKGTGQKTPIFSVLGNHDCNDELNFFSNGSNNVSGSCARIGHDLIIAGVGWTSTKFYDLPGEKEISKVCQSTFNAINSFRKEGDVIVILTHYPAYSKEIFSGKQKLEGWLFDSVRELIDGTKPMAVISGHIHELGGQQAVYVNKNCGTKTVMIFADRKGGILSIDSQQLTIKIEPFGTKQINWSH